MRILVSYTDGSQKVEIDDDKTFYLSFPNQNGERKIFSENGEELGLLTSEYPNGHRYARMSDGSEYDVSEKPRFFGGSQEIWDKFRQGRINELSSNEITEINRTIEEGKEIFIQRQQHINDQNQSLMAAYQQHQQYINDQNQALMAANKQQQDDDDDEWDEIFEEEKLLRQEGKNNEEKYKQQLLEKIIKFSAQNLLETPKQLTVFHSWEKSIRLKNLEEKQKRLQQAGN